MIHALTPIRSYLQPFRLHLVGVFIALILTSSSVLSLGYAIQYLIDQGFASDDIALFEQGLLIIMGITLLLAGATAVRAYLTHLVCEGVIAAIRKEVFSHVVRLSPGFFESSKVSDVISRLTNDTALVSGVIANLLSVAVRNALLLIGGIAMLCYTSPKLTLYTMLMVPLVVVPIILLGKRVRALSRISQAKVAKISEHLEESLQGIRTVQAFVREEFETHAFNGAVQEALEAEQHRLRVRAWLIAIVMVFVLGAILYVLKIGGHAVLTGAMSHGELSSFVFYAVLVAGSFAALSEVVTDLQRAGAGIDRIMQLRQATSPVIDPSTPKMLPKNIRGEIHFSNVYFTYPARPNHYALDGFSLHVKPGEMVALVGPSGAGKSTIMHVLLRFYDPESGTITLDGVDIKQLTLAHLREHIGVVLQDPVIFSTSAFDNIAYGKPTASEEEVIQAAKMAEAWEFIRDLPEGMDTYLGEKGVRLSGGQKQRIAIARAILKDPQILFLDEATSNLDSQNEKLVQKALARFMEGRTTIVIAHRFSTITHADHIILMEDGKVVATGKHDELLKEHDLYHRLATASLTA